MLEQYNTIYEGGEGEIIEKKSRFIATVRLVKTEEEALSFIEEMRKKYWNATHNCYAYVIGERKETMRCSDDGEPSGTAGKPMLDGIPITDSRYTEDVKLQVLVPKAEENAVKKAVTEATSARASITDLKELYYASLDGEYLTFED